MRGLLLLVAARAAEASSEAAVLLVGAAYDVDEARLRATKKFVVDAFGASETLVLLKDVHYNKNIYTEAEVRALRDVVAATLRPSFLDIRPGAELTHGYARNASRIGKCIWSRETSCLYRHSSSRDPLEVRIEAWWGVLQAAYGALTKRESIRGKAFDRVACVRADIEFTSPIRHSTNLEPRYVYAASDPPDAVFLFGSRKSAERVLTTYARVDALARDGKCAALDRARFMYSWFLSCYAVKELYGQGVRIVADPQIHGKIRLHTGGGTPGIHLLEAHALPIKFLHGVARQEPAVHEPRAVEGRAFSVPGERVDARVRREDPFRGTPAPEEEDGVGRVARGVDVARLQFRGMTYR